MYVNNVLGCSSLLTTCRTTRKNNLDKKRMSINFAIYYREKKLSPNRKTAILNSSVDVNNGYRLLIRLKNSLGI